MIRINVGDVLSLADMKTGEGKHGKWARIVVPADKGTNQIVVWATNAPEVANYKSKEARVEEITRVTLGSHQSGDRWFIDYGVGARLSEVNAQTVAVSDNDDDLPF